MKEIVKEGKKRAAVNNVPLLRFSVTTSLPLQLPDSYLKLFPFSADFKALAGGNIPVLS